LQYKENRISRIACGGMIGYAGRIDYVWFYVLWVKTKKEWPYQDESSLGRSHLFFSPNKPPMQGETYPAGVADPAYPVLYVMLFFRLMPIPVYPDYFYSLG